MESRLGLLLFAVIGTTLAGIAVTALLSASMGSGRYILMAAVAGFALALPVSWLVAKRMTHLLR